MDEAPQIGWKEDITKPVDIVWFDNHGEAGRLYVDGEDGRLKFKGDVDASAKSFFEHLIKEYCEPYIEQEIARRKEND